MFGESQRAPPVTTRCELAHLASDRNITRPSFSARGMSVCTSANCTIGRDPHVAAAESTGISLSVDGRSCRPHLRPAPFSPPLGAIRAQKWGLAGRYGQSCHAVHAAPKSSENLEPTGAQADARHCIDEHVRRPVKSTFLLGTDRPDKFLSADKISQTQRVLATNPPPHNQQSIALRGTYSCAVGTEGGHHIWRLGPPPALAPHNFPGPHISPR